MQLLILWILLQIWPTKAGLGDNNNGGIQEPAAEYLAEPGSYERLIEDTDGVRRHNLPTWTFYQITEEDIQQPLSEPVHSEEVNTVNKDVKQIGFGSTKRSQLKRRQRGKHRQLLPHNFNFHNNNNYSGRKWKEETHRNLTQLVHTLRREDPLTLSSLSVRHGIHRWRVKRDAPDDAFSPLRTRRRKRELDVDTRVGLIVGAVVLGVLAATLLICACIRCVSVKQYRIHPCTRRTTIFGPVFWYQGSLIIQ